MKRLFPFLNIILLLLWTTIVFSQIEEKDWQDVTMSEMKNEEFRMSSLPRTFRAVDISIPHFITEMNESQEIELPTPDGGFETFVMKPSRIIAEEVAHLYTVKTFKGYQKNDPTILMACDISPTGFHAAIYEEDKTYFIEPIHKDKPNRLIVFHHSQRTESKIQCHVSEEHQSHHHATEQGYIETRTPAECKVVRVVFTAAGEYSQQFGGTPYSKTNVLNAMASGLNMVQPIYSRDIGIQFSLVSDTTVVYDNPATDPIDYSNQGSMIVAHHTSLMTNFGANKFDLGHLLIWANTGGLAYMGAVCDSNYKGAGFSGAAGSISQLWVDYVAHELGHQFGASHNFSADECGTSSYGDRFEPGEGSSIMCYAGLCGVGYQSYTDPFFHYNSISDIQNYLNTTSCLQANDTLQNEAAPLANAQSDITIPKQTAFILVGTASDDNDTISNLTYQWEQYDGYASVTNGVPNCSSGSSSPLFRFRTPTTQLYRHFPHYSKVLNGTQNAQTWEKLPCVAKTMKFSFAVRDNNMNFGRMSHDLATVNVANTGPFKVLVPNGGEVMNRGNLETITWDVKGTDSHCSAVDIWLSMDGGTSYQILADSTANDGEEELMMPDTMITQGRILISCNVDGAFRSASTFYDISNANFSIQEDTPVSEIAGASIKVFPNPVQDKLFITSDIANLLRYELISVDGKVIQENALQYSTEISTSNIASGVYFLRIQHTGTGESHIQKIVVE